MRKKLRKTAITLLLALGLFINFSNTIQPELTNTHLPIGNSLQNDPIIGEH